MEAAIRWSAGTGDESSKYLLVDVAGNKITLNEARSLSKGQLQSKTIAQYDKVPDFSAFDWSKFDDSLIALGLSSGEASLVKIEQGHRNTHQLRLFPIKTQRKCNSITFNLVNLLAVGLDRVRNDHSLTVYDVESGKEPHSRLCTGEAVTSVRFFPNAPHEIVAAVARSTLRLYDLRDSSYSNAGSGASVYTKQVNNIAIDPLDDNYLASGGSTGDPTVSVWDRRLLSRPSNSSTDTTSSTPVLEFRPAVDNTVTTTVWSIRYSGLKRGRFSVLASTGEVKIYDMATYNVQSKTRPTTPANVHGGSLWSSPQYIARTHYLQHPYHESTRGQSESERVIAFDWVGAGSAEGQSVLALRSTRKVDLLYAPSPGHVDMTGRDDLAICHEDVAFIEPTRSQNTVADDMFTVKAKAERSGTLAKNGVDTILENPKTKAQPLDFKSLSALRTSSVPVNRTQRWLEGDLGLGDSVADAHDFGGSLMHINIHRRRCQEGYRFDCKRNEVIVKDDAELVKLWKIIGKLEGLARDGGMVTDSLDLSFLGVHSIWNGHLGTNQNRLTKPRDHSRPSFDEAVKDLVASHPLSRLDDLPSKTASKRLLCLEVCGWCFSRGTIEGKCRDLLEQGQHYRAVAISVFQGHSDMALILLRDLVRTRNIENTGVAALLASESMNDEQREMCQWMEEDASDPYLRALLRYLGARDWSSVVQDTTLNLSDRLSVALRYMSDPEVATFIYETTTTCINDGDLTGILLTGLTETSMNLFQNYLGRTNDLQTVVLATSFSNPLYVDDMRWSMWKETYLWHMQAWRTFIERTKFTTQHARRAVTRQGDRLVKSAPRQITLRCAHCNGSLAQHHDDAGQKSKKPSGLDSPVGPTKGTLTAQAQKVAAASGTVCPKCGRHLPRCSVCMQWLGTPDISQSKHGRTSEREIDGGKETGAARRETELLGRFVTFCASCGHGFHAHHAKHWFAKHGMCPVPDCRCLCGIRG